MYALTQERRELCEEVDSEIDEELGFIDFDDEDDNNGDLKTLLQDCLDENQDCDIEDYMCITEKDVNDKIMEEYLDEHFEDYLDLYGCVTEDNLNDKMEEYLKENINNHIYTYLHKEENNNHYHWGKTEGKCVSPEDGLINGHGYVDLGLPSGLKWATCNVGATMPFACGD